MIPSRKNTNASLNNDTESYLSTDSDKSTEDEDVEILMKRNYAYPEPSDPNLQYKIYKKREFHSHKYPERPDINDYNAVKEYRDNICSRNISLYEHQALVSNFINPDTPYKGVLIFHGVGSGKCCLPHMNVKINGLNITLENLWNKYSGHIENIQNNEEWTSPTQKLLINGFNDNKILPLTISKLYREKIHSLVKKITLKTGQSISMTLIHKLYKENIGWTNELQVGDKIAITNPQISYGEISSINYFTYNGYVYDLEIPVYHNYVVEDILSHNTCVGVTIAEKFKSLVQKYNTKIYILVPGPLLKDTWKYHLIKCTGEAYLRYQDKSAYIDEAEKAKLRKNAINQALQYYKFLTYRSFYKRVLGEKIVEKKVMKGSKVRVSFRKTEEGEFEREIAVDRIYNLNNTIILVDEAHGLTGNMYGDALSYIIKNSINLRVVLLTATPMKNLADDIVPLINFIRPLDSPMERDKIFDSNHNHNMGFKNGGIEYLKNMTNGYISHVKGADPMIFAKRVDKGEKLNDLLFTKLMRCKMLSFQKKVYYTAIRSSDDTLDRKSEAVANFAFPVLSSDHKEIEGAYGREGINIVRNQLKINQELINKKIAHEILNIEYTNDLLYIAEDGRTIAGKILKLEYLKHFSIKFYKSLKRLNRLVWGKKGPRLAFIYSNLVRVGIDLFQQILIQNGYLEFQENIALYNIQPDTICYFCGKTYNEHKNMQFEEIPESKEEKIQRTETLADVPVELYSTFHKTREFAETTEDEDDDYVFDLANPDNVNQTMHKKKGGARKKKRRKLRRTTRNREDSEEINNISDSSTDYEEYAEYHKSLSPTLPYHDFYPATFLSITGKSSEESAEFLPEEKKRILENIFNSQENIYGKHIKLILGSKVMNEGISLARIAEVHILDVYYNLGKVDQTVGRAIRTCSHYDLMNEKNKFPLVNVYKYVISIDDGLTTEEELYKKAELKYMLIKKVERCLKEVAFDCPLNMNGNVFKEEVEMYKNCGENGQPLCPSICDFQKCDYVCDNKKLNAEFYDPNRKMYRKIKKDDLDISTFTHTLASGEIEYAKSKIKEMYLLKYEYTLENIIEYVKESYSDDKKDLFDEFFVFKALDELTPITENDFLSFKDTIVDKFNRPGYLIYRGVFYIFQQLDQNEDVSMYYRTTFDRNVTQKLSLYNYLKNTIKYKELHGLKKKKDEDAKSLLKSDILGYKFDLEYYESRNEFKFVGVIDKEVSRRKIKLQEEINDVFKIRVKRAKVLEKKRGTGISSIYGAVCNTSKSRKYLEKVAKELDAVLTDKDRNRNTLCDIIKDRMIFLEKYDKDRITYIMIPINHPIIPFPLNLLDRVEYTKNKILGRIKFKIDLSVKTETKSSGKEKGMPTYIITIKDSAKLKEHEDFLKKLGAEFEKNKIKIILS